MPNTDTPLLLYGSSLMENSDVFRNRVFSIYDVIGIAADQWYIDYSYMEEQLGAGNIRKYARNRKSAGDLLL